MKTITSTTKLIFENSAELDPRAFTTMGISAKESDSAIGYFGTGLKYAIAVLLRSEHSVTVHSGGKRYDFQASPITFRDKEFMQCQYRVDGAAWVDLPYTTDLGKNWQLWMAYRELSSNCMDEAGTERIVPIGFSAPVGSTTIEVTGEGIESIHRNRSHYFISGSPLLKADNCDIYANRGQGAKFYKGVKVGEAPNAVFTYNVHSDVTLTEDRTIKNSFEFSLRVARAVAECDNEEVIRSVLQAPKDTFENHLDWSFAYRTSAVFERVIAEVHMSNAAALSASAKALLKRVNPAAYKPASYTPTPQETKKLAAVVRMFESYGLKLPPIEFAHTDTATLHGFVVEGVKIIYLTNYGLARGLGELAATVFEEYNHAVKGFGDFERPYQDYLQMLVVNFIAEKTDTLI